jgi:hypothetical protein
VGLVDAHLIKGLSDDRVDAVATAQLFNFVGDGSSQCEKDAIKNWNEFSKMEYPNCNESKRLFRRDRQ